MERYSLEQAQDEAEKMKGKISSGEATDHNEAEHLVETEKTTDRSMERISEIQQLYRGKWADKLQNNEKLPVGGYLFSTELTKKLELDFDSFSKDLEDFTREKIDAMYEKNKESVVKWLNQVGSDIDPQFYHLCFQIQTKMQKLLDVDIEDQYYKTPEGIQKGLSREETYEDGNTPKLSEIKGKTMCAERAVMGQYLLQKAGFESSYMSGITMHDAYNTDEYPQDHSFIILKDTMNDAKTFIFDIARPKSQSNMPRILKADIPITYELLKDKNDLLIGATEVLQGGRLWFGVGEPASKKHEVIDKT